MTAGGTAYDVQRLCADAQYQLLRAFSTALPSVFNIQTGSEGPGLSGVLKALTPILAAPDEEFAALSALCRNACVSDTGEHPPAALSMSEMLSIFAAVAVKNLGPYLEQPRPLFRTSPGRAPSFKVVEMPDGDDWLLRPVNRHFCHFESLLNGALHLEDIARLNNMIDVQDENEWRAHKAMEGNRG